MEYFTVTKTNNLESCTCCTADGKVMIKGGKKVSALENI